MAYCGPRGIPYTRFMGGPDGWDDLSQRAATWWLRFDRGRCRGCGTHAADWDSERGGDVWAFTAEPERCRGCELRGLEQSKIKSEDGHGWHVHLVPNLNSPRWGGPVDGADERDPDRVGGDAGDAGGDAEGVAAGDPPEDPGGDRTGGGAGSA